jgi:hypothetical protein
VTTTLRALPLKSLLVAGVFAASTACHWLMVGDGGVWVRGQIMNSEDETQCVAKVFYRNGGLANFRPVEKNFDVAMTIAPGTSRVFFEVGCGARSFRSTIYEVNSTSKFDLGTVTVK